MTFMPEEVIYIDCEVCMGTGQDLYKRKTTCNRCWGTGKEGRPLHKVNPDRLSKDQHSYFIEPFILGPDNWLPKINLIKHQYSIEEIVLVNPMTEIK